jgi:short-chain fatty acids transporter
MMNRLANSFYRVAVRIVPDPFVLALGLTAVVLLMAAMNLASLGAEGIFWKLIEGWLRGFGDAGGLAFALQMSLILVTGHALALSPPVQRLIARIALIPKSAAGSTALVAFVACAAAVIHWGLGAIVGAFLARELAIQAGRRGVAIHYPILGAAAYAGLAVWHGGLSGSAPLKVAEAGHFTETLVGIIPVGATLGSPLNLLTTGALLLLIPLLFYVSTPKKTEEMVPPPTFGAAEREPAGTETPETAIERFQASRTPGTIVGFIGVGLVILSVALGRLPFDINTVNLFFLFLGLGFHGSLVGYANTVIDGAKGAGGIILQFPFYFGILGVMKAGLLIEAISNGLLAISNVETFPVLAFYSAGLINMFVPSGGGQWAVQAHILLNAAKSLGVAPAATVMAFSYGDAWTNMLQPFWALPLLGIMQLKARDIIGYSLLVFFLMGAVVTLTLFVLA